MKCRSAWNAEDCPAPQAGGLRASSLRLDHPLAKKKGNYLLLFKGKVALCTRDGFPSSCQLLALSDDFRGSTKQLRWILTHLFQRSKLVPAKPEYWISFSSLAGITWISSSVFGGGKVFLPCPSSVLCGIWFCFGFFVLTNECSYSGIAQVCS